MSKREEFEIRKGNGVEERGYGERYMAFTRSRGLHPVVDGQSLVQFIKINQTKIPGKVETVFENLELTGYACS